MGRRFLLAAVVSPVLATVLASPALAQLAGNAPPPPEYQVEEDGTLVIGGDVLVRCAEVGLGNPYLGADDPEVRAQIEQSLRESARACEAAGFDTAVDLPSGSAPASSSASAPSGASATASSATPPGSPGASAAADAGSVLPETGGLALSALLLPAAAVLLSVGGLLALRARR